jgi:competence protein ComEC
MPQIALAILLGALLAFYGNQLQDPFWASFAPLLLLLARCNPKYRFVALLAAGMLWSGSLMQLHLSHRLVDDFDNRILLLNGVIADIPQLRHDRISLLLDDLEIEGYPAPLPRRARFNWYQVKQVPLAGERWQFRVRIRQPRGLLNPAGFDYERWLFVKGIDASGYVRAARENKRLQAAPVVSLNRWRGKLADSIERDCEQCRYTGLIKALALGLRGDIHPDARKLLQSSGTAHLLAISGLHIGMVALLGYGIGRYAWRLGGGY